jgi:diguanylate cyclase (GGDEF)-like protein
MSRTTQLAEHDPGDLAASAQVISLESENSAPIEFGHRYLHRLQLVNQLFRILDVEQMIETFLREIEDDVDCAGYQLIGADADDSIEWGLIRGFHSSYHLKVQNRWLGELTLYKTANFTDRELRRLEEWLPVLIYPLKNALMYKVALRSAYRDPLTGLNNRTAMEKHLPREIDFARRYGQTLAVMVMDLDGFKRINDVCGHDCGDHVLHEVGQVISRVMRNTDLVYRYGGDEFVGGLPRTDVAGAMDVAERIRASVENLDLSDCCKIDRVHMSVGITLSQHEDDFRSAFKRADKALYQAKRNGKNQIVVY